MELTQEYLKSIVDYNHETGEFFSKRHTRVWQIGKKLGGINTIGYHTISIDNKRYLSHRLAWLYMTGEWPKQDIDHINGNRGDNRFTNLRDVSRSINQQNIHRPQKNNKYGFLGVAKENSKFAARIYYNGKQHRIGLFDTPEEAHEAYLKVKRIVHSGCSI